MRTDFIDFPTAWDIQKNHLTVPDHEDGCSSVEGWHPLSGPGLLCDCGAIEKKWKELTANEMDE